METIRSPLSYLLYSDFGEKTSNSESLLSVNKSLDTVVHVLGELDLVAAETAQVGDVEHAIVSLGVLTVGTADLDVVLVGNALHEGLVLLELGQVDVDGSAHASAQVGGAVGDVTEMLIRGELGLLLNGSRGDGETLEHLTDVGTLLHGDDTELILFVNPDEESLGVVVEDTTGLRPVTLETAGLEILVATLEQEVVSNELVTLSVGHGLERVVLALELTSKAVKSSDNLALESLTVSTADGGTERVLSRVTGNTDTGGVDHLVLIWGEVGASQVSVVHVDDVLICGLVAVIRLNDLVHEGSEVIVRLMGASIDTDTGVGPLGTGEDGLLEGEAVLVLAVLALFPNIAGEALVEERLSARGEVRESSDVFG